MDVEFVQNTHQQNSPAVSWSITRNIAPDGLNERDVSMQSSVLDLLAAPTVILQQVLVYEQQLVPALLQGALQDVVDEQPVFAARLSVDKDEQLRLALPQDKAGISMLEGHTRGLSLQQILSHNTTAAQSSQQQHCPELADLLFQHLPGALLPAYKENPDLALVCVAVVFLQGGGCLLGFRMSHLLGDWGSLQLFIQATAAAYSKRAAQQQLQPDRQQRPDTKMCSTEPASCAPDASSTSGGLVPAAPLLNQLVLHTQRQLPADFNPVRFKHLTSADEAKFAELAALSAIDSSTDAAADNESGDAGNSSSSSSSPQRSTYHVPPARLQQLKADAAAQAAAAAMTVQDSSHQEDMRWCSSHNVILARLLRAFVTLPGRASLLHDISVAVDMRSKLPQRSVEVLSLQQQQQLRHCVGNFFATAIYEGCCGADQLVDWQLAQKLYEAVQDVRNIWLPDLAWASQVLQLLDTEPIADKQQQSAEHCLQQGSATLEHPNQPAKKAITWRRLHAMGPSTLLPKQMDLGLLPSLSTTQWPLDVDQHTCMAGLLPVVAVPGFSQPQPYPLVLLQQATAAAGGGVMVHVFLDTAEANALQQAIQAQGGI